jgi:hypothetical protein
MVDACAVRVSCVPSDYPTGSLQDITDRQYVSGLHMSSIPSSPHRLSRRVLNSPGEPGSPRSIPKRDEDLDEAK